MTVVSISMTACQTTSSCEWRLILIGSVSVDFLCGAVQWPRALLHVCPGHHTPIFHVRHSKPVRHISSDAIRGKLALRPIYFTIIWILHQSLEFCKKCQTPWQSKSAIYSIHTWSCRSGLLYSWAWYSFLNIVFLNTEYFFFSLFQIFHFSFFEGNKVKNTRVTQQS